MNNKIQEIRDRHKEATEGPYIFKCSHNEYGLYGKDSRIISFGGSSGYEEFRGQEPGMDDETFLQSSWSDIAYLLSECERLTLELNVQKDLTEQLQSDIANNEMNLGRMDRMVEGAAIALEWYADKGNYDPIYLELSGRIPIDDDEGKRAMAALSHIERITEGE